MPDLVDLTDAPLPIAPSAGGAIGGAEVGPGPGVYHTNLSLEGTPNILPWVMEAWQQRLRVYDLQLDALPTTPFQVVEPLVRKSTLLWPDPRVGAACDGRRDPWEANHAMVLLGRWRPPRIPTTRLQASRGLVQFWYQHSLPMFLVRGCVKRRKTASPGDDFNSQLRMYRLFTRAKDMNLGYLQRVYAARHLLPALRTPAPPLAFSAPAFRSRLELELLSLSVPPAAWPREPLMRYGRWSMQELRPLSGSLTAQVRSLLLPQLPLSPSKWTAKLLWALLSPTWLSSGVVDGQRALIQLCGIYAVYGCARVAQFSELSAAVTPFLACLSPDVFNSAIGRQIHEEALRRFPRTALSQYLDLSWAAYSAARRASSLIHNNT